MKKFFVVLLLAALVLSQHVEHQKDTPLTVEASSEPEKKVDVPPTTTQDNDESHTERHDRHKRNGEHHCRHKHEGMREGHRGHHEHGKDGDERRPMREHRDNRRPEHGESHENRGHHHGERDQSVEAPQVVKDVTQNMDDQFTTSEVKDHNLRVLKKKFDKKSKHHQKMQQHQEEVEAEEDQDDEDGYGYDGEDGEYQDEHNYGRHGKHGRWHHRGHRMHIVGHIVIAVLALSLIVCVCRRCRRNRRCCCKRRNEYTRRSADQYERQIDTSNRIPSQQELEMGIPIQNYQQQQQQQPAVFFQPAQIYQYPPQPAQQGQGIQGVVMQQGQPMVNKYPQL